MEYLDTYDENQKYIGTFTRDEVHQKGLWHKTVHCWLYDKEGNVYFQIRKNSKKLYTTASGHVLSGESLKQGFVREVKEEIGLDLDFNKIKKIDTVIWKMDQVKQDGTIIKDRAFSNTYIGLYSDEDRKFNLDPNEVLGIVKINAKEAIELFKGLKKQIKATYIHEQNKEKDYQKNITIDDFVVMTHETPIGKYGNILEEIIKITSHNE